MNFLQKILGFKPPANQPLKPNSVQSLIGENLYGLLNEISEMRMDGFFRKGMFRQYEPGNDTSFIDALSLKEFLSGEIYLTANDSLFRNAPAVKCWHSWWSGSEDVSGFFIENLSNIVISRLTEIIQKLGEESFGKNESQAVKYADLANRLGAYKHTTIYQLPGYEDYKSWVKDYYAKQEIERNEHQLQKLEEESKPKSFVEFVERRKLPSQESGIKQL